MLRPVGMSRLLIIAILFGALVPPFAPVAADGSRAVPPDLYILPEEVYLSSGEDEIYAGYIAWFYVGVHNKGPGVSASANVSFYLNGTLLSAIPIEDELSVSGPFNFTDIYFEWNTTSLLPGNYSMRIVVMDAAGDADTSNNNVTRNVTVSPNPPPPTAIHVSISPPSQSVVVSESSQGSVHFMGNVSVDIPEGGFTRVYLVAAMEPVWAANVNPSTFLLTDNSSHAFSVKVTVPQASPAGIPGVLTVDARALTLDSSIEGSARANVTVRAYYRIMMEIDMPSKEVEPGQPAAFGANCWNVGNSIDDYSISITNRADLEKKGWTLTLNRTSLNRVGPNNFSRFRLMATPPRDLSISKYEPTMIDVKVVSVGAERTGNVVTQSFPLYIYQKGINKPVVGGISAAIGLLVVAVIIVALRVRRKRKAPPGHTPVIK